MRVQKARYVPAAAAAPGRLAREPCSVNVYSVEQACQVLFYVAAVWLNS